MTDAEDEGAAAGAPNDTGSVDQAQPAGDSTPADGAPESDTAPAANPAGPLRLSLQQCHTMLAAEFGEGFPAYITLKRWGLDGYLDAATHRAEGRRPTYDLAGVRRICLERTGGRFLRQYAGAPAAQPASADSALLPPGAASPAAPTASPDILQRLEQIEAAMRRLEESTQAMASIAPALASLTTTVDRAARAAEQLEASRRQLMTTMDGERTALRGQVQQLRDELSQSGGIERALARLGQLATRLERATTGGS